MTTSLTSAREGNVGQKFMEDITGEMGLKLGTRIPGCIGVFYLGTGHKTLLRSKDSEKLSYAFYIPDDLQGL